MPDWGGYAMPFECPHVADFVNARSLNRAFLQLLGNRYSGLTEPLSAELAARLRALSMSEIERLSAAPFLLFSISEWDDRLWQSLLDQRECQDLLTAAGAGDAADRVTAATLGFAWQLAKQNPYSARLICGASLHWCEMLAEQTIYSVLAAAATHNDLLKLRAAADSRLWSKLLGSGISRDKQVRTAAHLTALGMLTRNPQPAERQAWASAACVSRQPVLKIAENPAGDD